MAKSDAVDPVQQEIDQLSALVPMLQELSIREKLGAPSGGGVGEGSVLYERQGPPKGAVLSPGETQAFRGGAPVFHLPEQEVIAQRLPAQGTPQEKAAQYDAANRRAAQISAMLPPSQPQPEVPLSAVPAMVGEMTGATALRNTIENPYIPTPTDLWRGGKRARSTLIGQAEPFRGVNEAIDGIPRAAGAAMGGNLLPGALSAAEAAIGMMMSIDPTGAAWQVLPQLLEKVSPTGGALLNTGMAPAENIFRPESPEGKDAAKLVDLLWQFGLLKGTHKAGQAVSSFEPPPGGGRMMPPEAIDLATRTSRRLEDIRNRRAYEQGAAEDVVRRTMQQQQAGLTETPPTEPAFNVQDFTERNVPANPNLRLEARRATTEFERAFRAAQASGTPFNLAKRFTEDLATKIGDDIESLQRIQTLLPEIRDYNAKMRPLEQGRPVEPETPPTPSATPELPLNAPVGPSPAQGEPIAGPVRPPEQQGGTVTPAPGTNLPPLGGPETPAPVPPGLNRDNIITNLHDSVKRLNDQRRFKGRADFLHEQQLYASKNNLDLRIDKTGKAQLFDLSVEGEPKLLRQRSESMAKPEEGAEATLLKDLPVEHQQAIEAVGDQIGEVLDVTGLSKDQVRGAFDDIRKDAGKEGSYRAQEVIREILRAARQDGTLGVRMGQKQGSWMTEGTSLDDIIRAYEESKERASFEDQKPISEEPTPPEEPPAFEMVGRGKPPKPQPLPQEEMFGAPPEPQGPRPMTSEEYTAQMKQRAEEAAQGRRAELSKLEDRRSQLLQEIKGSRELYGKENQPGLSELRGLNERIGKLRQQTGQTGPDLSDTQETMFGAGLGGPIASIAQNFKQPPQLEPENPNPQSDQVRDEYMERVSVGEHAKRRRSATEWLQDHYASLVHAQAPLERMSRVAEREGILTPARDVYGAVQRARGGEAISMSAITGKGTVKFDPTTQDPIVTGSSFQKRAEPVSSPENFADFRALITATDAIERRGLGQGYTGPEKQTPEQTIAALQQKWGKNFTQLEDVANSFHEWERLAVVEPLIEAGRISRETAASWKSRHQYHVPLNRIFEDEGTVSPQEGKSVGRFGVSFIKRAGKSAERILDPVETALVRSVQANQLMQHQKVSEAILNLKEAAPDLDAAIVEKKPPMVMVAKVKHEVLRDVGFRESLLKYAQSLGAQYQETPKIRGRGVLGYFMAPDLIRLKHISNEHVLAHEIGHLLDLRLGLQDKFMKFFDANITKVMKAGPQKGQTVPDVVENRKIRVQINQELRAIADMRKVSPGYGHKGTEKMAEMIGAYLYAPELMTQNAPKVKEILEKFIGQYPELKGIKDVSKSLELGLDNWQEEVWRQSKFQPPNTFVKWVDGKRKFYEAPKEVLNAIEQLRPPEAWSAFRAANKVARILRAGATLTPEFQFGNPARDLWTSWIYGKYWTAPGEYLFRGLADMLGSKKYAEEFRTAGGEHSSLLSLDRKTVQSLLGEATTQTIMGRLAHHLNPLEALRATSAMMENATRIGAFAKMRTKGETQFASMKEAREITQDFSRQGANGRIWNMIVPFWSANLGGFDKIGREIRNNPGRFSARVAPLMVASLALWNQHKDDTEFKEMPGWEKALFWHFKIFRKDGSHFWFRVPKPFEVGTLFASIPEGIANLAYRKDPAMLERAVTQMGGGLFNLPTIVGPTVEAMANYSFFTGKPIVSSAKQGLPTEFQASDYTSETAKQIGKTVGLAPAKVEYLVRGYTGGLGRWALQGLDKILEGTGISNPPVKPERGPEAYVGIGRFISRPAIGQNSESVQRFYDMWEKARAAQGGVNQIEKRGDVNAYKDFVKKNPILYLAPTLNHIGQSFSHMNSARTQILSSRELTAQQKRQKVEEIDRLLTDTARKFIEQAGPELDKLNQ